jgi:hypothetical protein
MPNNNRRVSTNHFPEFPNIEVISEGCNDPIRSEGCGLAYTYIDGEQKSPQKRGHNFVIINALTGKDLTESLSFTFQT